MQRQPARIVLLVAILPFAQHFAFAEVLDKSKNLAGTTVHYKVVLPNSHDPAMAYPAVLAFPGGPQTIQVVANMVARNWRKEA
jgi:dipeptidyl aminopeptidase/acylaminoacyl peptidase